MFLAAFRRQMWHGYGIAKRIEQTSATSSAAEERGWQRANEILARFLSVRGEER